MKQCKKQNKKTSDVDLLSDIYRLISFKLGVIMDTTTLYDMIAVLMTLIFIQHLNYMRKQKLLCIFLTNFESVWIEFGMLPWPVDLFNCFLAWLMFKEENSISVCFCIF